MKTLRRISAVTALSLTLAVSALAGHIETTGAPGPGPGPRPDDSLTAPYITTYIVLTITNLIYR